MKRLYSEICRFNQMPARWAEFIVLGLYLLTVALLMFFHEPWYDEAQAWLIARDSSLHDLLFVIPHYEGHPPFWFLLLAAFARAGADFDLTVKVLTLSINTVAVALLLFRAPFPRLVRFALPFTYFLFYQHGVICRPYSLLLIGFLLTAAFWREKDEKPVRICLSLMLMCASSAYGIIFAGGITLAWLAEGKKGKAWKEYFCGLFSRRRFLAWGALLLFALLQILLILPRDDTFAASYGMNDGNPLCFRVLYMFFGSVADATCFSAYETYDELRYATFSTTKAAIGILIGCMLLAGLYLWGKKCRTRLLLLVPFCLFAGFSALVYFYLQHIDVLQQFLIFWCWVSAEACRHSSALEEETPTGGQLQPAFRHVSVATVSLCLLISVYWNIAACRNEVLHPYGFAKELSVFLDNHGLTSYGISVRWSQTLNDYGELIYINTAQTVNGVALNAYYDRNIVNNMNVFEPSIPFATHRIPTDEENEKTVQAWREQGLPAVTLDRCQLATVFPELENIYATYYTDVKSLSEYHIWKGSYIFTEHHVFVRNDVARKLLLP